MPAACVPSFALRAVARASVGALFAPEFRRDTLALAAAFFFCLLAAYTGVSWVPTLLTSAGFDVAMANYGLTAFNLGGVVGAIVGAIAFARLGSRLTMLAMTACLGGCCCSPASRRGPVDARPARMLADRGLSRVQRRCIPGAPVYPAGIRATGLHRGRDRPFGGIVVVCGA